MLFAGLAAKIMKGLGGNKSATTGFEMGEGMMQMMNGFTILRLTNLIGSMGI